MNPIEDAGEIQAPLYAWRCYKVVRLEETAYLTPLYFSAISTDGKPMQAPYAGFDHLTVDLLGWNEADAKPRAYEETITMDENVHGVPTEVRYTENRQGIHAFHGKGQAIKYAEDFLSTYTRLPVYREVVMTKIELQGEVIEHEFGYRAEKARVIEIHAGGNDDERADLANLMGWPFDIYECDMIPHGPQLSEHPPFPAVEANIAHLAEALMNLNEPLRKVAKAVDDMVQYHEQKYPLHNYVRSREEVLFLKLKKALHIPQARMFVLYCCEILGRKIAADWGYLDPWQFKKLEQEIAFMNPWVDFSDNPIQFLDPGELLEHFANLLAEAGLPVTVKRYNPTQARNMRYGDGKNERRAIVLDYINAPMIAPPADIQVNITPHVDQYQNELRLQAIYGRTTPQKPNVPRF